MKNNNEVKLFNNIMFDYTTFSCQTEKKEDKKELDTQFVEHELQLTTQNTTIIIDSVILKESFQEEDEEVNEYLTETLEPIRGNFKRINSKTNWTKIDTIDVWESTEGGFAIFFYSKYT